MKKYILLTLLLLAAIIGLWGADKTETPSDLVTYAGALYTRLYDADQTVADQIDWGRLIVYGHLYFEDYQKLTTDATRLAFQKDFIANFATLGDKISPSELSEWNDLGILGYTIVSTRGEDFILSMAFTKAPKGYRLYSIDIVFDDEYNDEDEDW